MSAARRVPRRPPSAARAGGSVTTPVRRARRSWRSTGSAPPRHALLALQLAQHGLRALEVAAEDPPRHVQQLAHGRVAHRVAHRRAVSAGLDDTLRAQAGQVLGDGRLVELERLLQILHTAAAVAEGLADADTGGVPERLEEVRLQTLQLEAPPWLGHINVDIAI